MFHDFELLKYVQSVLHCALMYKIDRQLSVPAGTNKVHCYCCCCGAGWYWIPSVFISCTQNKKQHSLAALFSYEMLLPRYFARAVLLPYF